MQNREKYPRPPKHAPRQQGPVRLHGQMPTSVADKTLRQPICIKIKWIRLIDLDLPRVIKFSFSWWNFGFVKPLFTFSQSKNYGEEFREIFKGVKESFDLWRFRVPSLNLEIKTFNNHSNRKPIKKLIKPGYHVASIRFKNELPVVFWAGRGKQPTVIPVRPVYIFD